MVIRVESRRGAGVVASDVIGRREGSPGAGQSPAFPSHATKPRANPPSHSGAAVRRTCSSGHSGVVAAYAPEAVWVGNPRVPELLSVSS